MNINAKLNGIFLRIWIWASIINALLSAFVLSNQVAGFMGIFMLSLIFSFIFSVPVLIGTVLLSYLLISYRLIPNILLHVMLVCGICAGTGAFLYSGILSEIDYKSFELGVCIVLSSMLAPFCCYRYIQRIQQDENAVVSSSEEEILNNNSTTVL